MDSDKTVLTRKFIALNAYIRKKNSKILDLISTLRKSKR